MLAALAMVVCLLTGRGGDGWQRVAVPGGGVWAYGSRR
jgi:hypothetical protein